MASSFSVNKDLPLSSDIVQTCWCPTMDLCAVVSNDGQLHLHRMDWQQLWAVSPEVRVQAVGGAATLTQFMSRSTNCRGLSEASKLADGEHKGALVPD